MKKIFLYILVLSATLLSCEKDEAVIPDTAHKKCINFYNVSKTQSILKDWVNEDGTVSFDIFVNDYLSSDLQVNISVIPDLTTMSDDMYSLPETSFTIQKGKLKATGNVTFHYSAIPDVTKDLYLLLEQPSNISNGYNDTLKLSCIKMPNPTLTVFNDASLMAYYDGWDSPVSMAPEDESNPSNSNMIINNLWWGGEDIIIEFDLDNNTVHIAADQVLDAGWFQEGYTLPWVIGEVNGTYDPVAKTISFDYSIKDANGLLYGTEPCIIMDAE